MNSTLFLITNSYPLGGRTEEGFINPELKSLLLSFNKIIIIPDHIEENCNNYEINIPNIDVDTSYALNHDYVVEPKRLLWTLLKWKCFFILIRELKRIRSKKEFFSYLAFYRNAFDFAKWFITKYSDSSDNICCYTFWFHTNTTGLAMASEKIRMRLFSRAHRYDIFDDQVTFRSHELRKYTLSKLQQLFPCSMNGANYLKNHYPEFKSIIKTSFLGSIRKYPVAQFEPTSEITFLSCARMHKVKRIHLIPKFISQLALKHPNQNFTWIHVGDGDEMEKIKDIIKSTKLPNLQISLLGALPNDDVHKLYISRKIDWNILLSSNEGLPITLCESISYGVPVIATNVGGVSELVNPTTGILLSPNPTISEFISKIEPFITNPRLKSDLNNSALNIWENKFNALKLRNLFTSEIACR